MSSSESHADALESLDHSESLGRQLETIHAEVQRRFPSIGRISVSIYDRDTGSLSTFIASPAADDPLPHYRVPLAQVPSLLALLRGGRPRVVDDLCTLDLSGSDHSSRIREHGFQSSYTIPIHFHDAFGGFIFFDSTERAAFNEATLAEVDLFAHLIASLVMQELTSIRMVRTVIRIIHRMVHVRDPETGLHLERMAAYARLIAEELARRTPHTLSDETIEEIHLFAPLHDVGKVGIPDRVLLKAGALDADEIALMRTHTIRGAELVGAVAEMLGFRAFSHVRTLHNIVEFHHERIDGTGYPAGLRGEEIPLEARIVAVADVYDALTSVRPYKGSWTHDEAAAALNRLSGHAFDPRCVDALLSQHAALAAIRARFVDNGLTREQPDGGAAAAGAPHL